MRHLILLLLPCLLVAGCLRQQPPLQPFDTAKAPDPTAILADLAAQEDALKSFEARKVSLVLRGAGMQAKQQISGAAMYYEKPGKLHLRGQKLGNVYRLTVNDTAFLFESRGDQTFYHRDGRTVERSDAPLVSPGDVVDELFSPEPWPEIDARKVETAPSAAVPGGIELHFPSRRGRGFLRVLTVQEVAGAWRLVRNELLHDEQCFLRATYAEYLPQGDLQFPMNMEVQFPQDNDAFLRFSIGTITLNTPVDPEFFNLNAQLEAVRSKGYVERESEY